MSCANEKLLTFYGLDPNHLDSLLNAKNYVSNLTKTEPQTYRGSVFTPTYDQNQSIPVQEVYNTKPTTSLYMPITTKQYDFAPAKMPVFNPIQKKEQNVKLHKKHETLQELIKNAKEEIQWMSMTQ